MWTSAQRTPVILHRSWGVSSSRFTSFSRATATQSNLKTLRIPPLFTETKYTQTTTFRQELCFCTERTQWRSLHGCPLLLWARCSALNPIPRICFCFFLVLPIFLSVFSSSDSNWNQATLVTTLTTSRSPAFFDHFYSQKSPLAQSYFFLPTKKWR